ncbi:ArsR/SmtB family transcription factor [Paraburkholderia sp. BCC1886]|uniref:ArsR/SmtB family transcription factor n=1 Tax=Paraburkholderia sp. BCC1886 TaxID=2562670 RepID=UPI00118244AC|nr:metalloregulator ArsR/SmtB family transcription factor [Paraburkholderia sp. BCC1886]
MSVDIDKPELIAVANGLRIVSHPSRLAIALLLLDGPCAVSEIEATLSLRQPNLSQHLGILRDANLLSATRQAKSVVYELADGLPRELVRALSGAIDRVNRPSQATPNAKSQTATSSAHETKPAAATPAAASADKPASAPATHGAPLRATSAESDDGLLFAHVLQRRTDA